MSLGSDGGSSCDVIAIPTIGQKLPFLVCCPNQPLVAPHLYVERVALSIWAPEDREGSKDAFGVTLAVGVYQVWQGSDRMTRFLDPGTYEHRDV